MHHFYSTILFLLGKDVLLFYIVLPCNVDHIFINYRYTEEGRSWKVYRPKKKKSQSQQCSSGGQVSTFTWLNFALSVGSATINIANSINSNSNSNNNNNNNNNLNQNNINAASNNNNVNSVNNVMFLPPVGRKLTRREIKVLSMVN